MQRGLLTPLLVAAMVAGCQPPATGAADGQADAASAPPAGTAAAAAARSVVRIRTTSQSWNPGQPWERTPPRRRGGLGALAAPGLVLTTAEMAADATFIQFQSIDGTRTPTAEVAAVDYEANLALLRLEDPEGDGGFFDGMAPLELADDPQIGDALEIVQVEDSGRTLVTRGTLHGVDVAASLLANQFFLTFEVKASMQSAASSYTLPVLRNGRLAGILTSYDSKDQMSSVVATEILRHFLAQAAAGDGDYTGFPAIGLATTRTDDPSFRAWLRLPEGAGGLYIHKVLKDSPAAVAGITVGDVLLAVDGTAIDRRGFFEHPGYGPMFWSHLIRGSKPHGAKVQLDLWRDGAPTKVKVVLERRAREHDLVPEHRFGQAPPFLVKGGLIFQELSRPLLESFGKEWESQAPLNLLDALQNPDAHDEDRERIVFLSGVIGTPATIGYERLRNLIVAEANGRRVRDMKSLIDAFDNHSDSLHSIKFEEEEFTVYLDEIITTAVDEQLIQRGLHRLSRAE